MSQKKKKKKKEPNPTLFVLEGAIMHYEDGTMFSLHSQITREEWEQIVEETIKYEIYLSCLKGVVAILEEKWTEEDDWFRLQMGVAVKSMRELDPLLVAKFNRDEIKKDYSKQMTANATSMADQIKKMRAVNQSSNIRISNL